MSKKNSSENVKKAIMLATIQNLLKKKDSFSSVEVQKMLQKTKPDYQWSLEFINACLQDFVSQGVFSIAETEEEVPVKAPKKAAATKTPTEVVAKTPKVVPTNTTKSTSKKDDKWKTTKTCSRTTAINMMSNNKGRFFSVQFTKKDGNSLRTMNCQFLPNQKITLGVVKVKEMALVMKKNPNPIRSFDIDTVTKVSINGEVYSIRKK